MEECCMKKAVIFLFLAMVLFGSCSKKQSIVGTWTDVEGTKWIFSADGKLKYENRADDIREYNYSVFDGEHRTELTIFEVTFDMYILPGITDQKYTMEFSKDGKTLRLTGAENLNGWRVAGPGWGTNQLIRQSNSIQKNILINNPFVSSIKKLNGTWKTDDGFELRFNNNYFEFYINGNSYIKGTYTAKGGKLTTTTTHIGSVIMGGEKSSWYSIDENEEEIADYSISGNKLTITLNGVTTISNRID
jgi:hypothetical protein